MEGCNYSLAYVGPCGKPVEGEDGYCAQHTGLKCCVCSKKATHECPETCGLVCGTPLCNGCEPGAHSWHGGFRHWKKGFRA